jgi:hypothetical protein
MGVGHGLLSQMNTISGYGNDRNFVRACISAANDTKSSFNGNYFWQNNMKIIHLFLEDEPDLWLLTEVCHYLQINHIKIFNSILRWPNWFKTHSALMLEMFHNCRWD